MENKHFIEHLRIKIEELKTLVEVSLHITSTLDKKILLPRIMEAATKVMKAEASALMLVDELTDELYFEVALGEKGEEIKQLRVKIGEGIAGTVAKTGKPLLVKDVSLDERFASRFDNETGFKTKSILCVPMKIEDHIIGVLEVINRKERDRDYFIEEDIELCVTLGNLAAVAVHNAESYRNAITDKLTQLYNFGYFREQLNKEIARARRYGHLLSLCMMDIDYFKNYNDKNGHQEGNIALVKTSDIIIKNSRDSDTIARYGGEEFIAMLPQTSKEEALVFAERVRNRVGETPYSGDKNQPSGKVTISIGIATFPEDATDIQELIVNADKALYRSKQNGRNRVTLYSEK